MMPMLTLLRPKQWIKNVFVFAALIFAGKLGDYLLFGKVFLGFGLFCFASGCVYILNDLLDYEYDCKHPVKKYRPLASGTVSSRCAIRVLIVLSCVVTVSSVYLDLRFFGIIVLYFLLNVFYCVYAKNKVILDVLIIALSFVLRGIGGSFLIGERFLDISPWFLICILFLALFLALSKRRAELVHGQGKKTRAVLEQYSLDLLTNFLSIISSAIIISYSLYTFTCQHSVYLIITIPLVIYGLFRYYYLIYTSGDMECAETIIWQDKPLLIDVLLWILFCMVIIYFL